VKPPVEAPTSRQMRPRGSMRKASKAAESFTPPRETQGCSGPSSSTAAPSSTAVPGFGRWCPSTLTRPARMRASARVREGARPFSTRR
jgi:hypothetical protein